MSPKIRKKNGSSQTTASHNSGKDKLFQKLMLRQILIYLTKHIFCEITHFYDHLLRMAVPQFGNVVHFPFRKIWHMLLLDIAHLRNEAEEFMQMLVLRIFLASAYTIVVYAVRNNKPSLILRFL